MSDFLNSLIDSLNETTEALVEERLALGNYLSAEHTQRLHVWMDSEGTDRTKDKLAAFHTLNITDDIYTCKAKIAALEDQRTRILALIEVEIAQLRLQANLNSTDA